MQEKCTELNEHLKKKKVTGYLSCAALIFLEVESLVEQRTRSFLAVHRKVKPSVEDFAYSTHLINIAWRPSSLITNKKVLAFVFSLL